MSSPSLVVFGASGFVGSSILRLASTSSLSATGVCRSPPPAGSSPLSFTRGNALQPSTFTHLLTPTSSCIHSIGALYNGMGGNSVVDANYNSAMSIARELGKKASTAIKPPCFVYISAANAPPGLGLYLQSKRDAERDLAEIKGIRLVILRFVLVT
jgi:uncharacterized protein YbjT (DUF2867 family)